MFSLKINKHCNLEEEYQSNFLIQNLFKPLKYYRDWTGDQISLQDILSNSVHCTPFWSQSICPYCADRVDVVSITCWIDHFANVHRTLFLAVSPALHAWELKYVPTVPMYSTGMSTMLDL